MGCQSRDAGWGGLRLALTAGGRWKGGGCRVPQAGRRGALTARQQPASRYCGSEGDLIQSMTFSFSFAVFSPPCRPRQPPLALSGIRLVSYLKLRGCCHGFLGGCQARCAEKR